METREEIDGLGEIMIEDKRIWMIRGRKRGTYFSQLNEVTSSRFLPSDPNFFWMWITNSIILRRDFGGRMTWF
jgi:hypothetical protein